MLETIESFSESQIREVHQLFQEEWWTFDRTLDETRLAIDQSQLCLGFVDKEGTVFGFARVLTDFIFKTMVFDVIIAHRMRGQGFGKKMMETLVSHSQLTRTRHLELYCLPELVPFYKSIGFSTSVSGVQLIRRESKTERENSC